jgi:hypothetical protein
MGPSTASLPARKAFHPCKAAKPRRSIHSANGIRTRVWALRGPRPSPLDDSAATIRPVHRASIYFKQPDRPGGNRTPNRRFWRPVLYQLSYGPRAGFATFSRNGWLTGIEPATPGATDRCSNQLSYSHHEKQHCILIPFDSRINRSCQLIRHRAAVSRREVLPREYARSGGAPNYVRWLRSLTGLLVAR